MANYQNCPVQTLEPDEPLGLRLEPPDESSKCLSPELIETDFAELKDGSLLEMIEDPEDCSKSCFVLYKDGEARIVDRHQDGERLLVPVPRDKHIVAHVRFARGIAGYDSVRKLLRATYDLITKCLDLDFHRGVVLAQFVLSTWVIDQLPVAPYLAFIGLPQSGKSTALAVLNLLCRRALLTGDISSAGVYEICNSVMPTLLIDEAGTAGNKRALFHLLRTGNTRDVTVIRRRGSFKLFGAKAMSWTELPNDPALNSRCVLISMTETQRTDLKKASDSEIIKVAGELQKQFLQFRLANYGTLRLPYVAGAEKIHSRSRDLYEALALPLGDDPQFCAALVSLLTWQQDRSREPLSPTQSALLQTLFTIIHSVSETGTYAVQDLTHRVNYQLQGTGERFRATPRGIGAALSSLGFIDRKRTNRGWVVWLDRPMRKSIHQLADAYGFDSRIALPTSERREHCEFCVELAPTASDKPEPQEKSEDSAPGSESCTS